MGSKNEKSTLLPAGGGVKGYLFVREAAPTGELQPVWPGALQGGVVGFFASTPLYVVVAGTVPGFTELNGAAKLGLPPTSPMPASLKENGGAVKFWSESSSSTWL